MEDQNPFSKIEKKDIKLNLVEISRNSGNSGFHQEFMSKINEFSESWR